MNVIDRKAVAAHVLSLLADAQKRGRLVRLDELAQAVAVRRKDVREVISSLHAEGHVDAQRMRLTMTGLVLATAMAGAPLRAVRAVRAEVRPAKVA